MVYIFECGGISLVGSNVKKTGRILFVDGASNINLYSHYVKLKCKNDRFKHYIVSSRDKKNNSSENE